MMLLHNIFCRQMRTKADFVDWIADFQDLIDNPTRVPPAVKTVLDKDASGTVDFADMMYWLDYLIRRTIGQQTRLPVTGDWGANPADSDPLDLRDRKPSNSHVIIIDPQNTDAVRIIDTPSGNRCTDQSNVDKNPVALFTGGGSTAYNYSLWEKLVGLNESGTPADGVPLGNGISGATVFRFPSDGSSVYVLVRGGDQEINGEITLTKNNGGHTAPARIVVRNYPGEQPTIYHANSADGGVYRSREIGTGVFLARVTTWEGIEHVGYIGAEGSRIFTPYLFTIRGRDSLGGVGADTADASVLRRCILRDHRPIAAGTPAGMVDSQYHNRKFAAEDDITGGSANTLIIASQNVLVEECYFRSAADDWPYAPAITNVTSNAGVSYVLTSNDHGLIAGQTLDITGIVGSGNMQSDLNVSAKTITSVTQHTITINDNSASGTYTSGGRYRASDRNGDCLAVTNAGSVTVRRCVFDGQAHHIQCNAGGVPGDSVIEYCSIRNPAHTCIGIGAGTVRYNRIEAWNDMPYQTLAIQVASAASSFVSTGEIVGNVIWDYGTGGATASAANAALALTSLGTDAEVDGWEIHRNIIFGGLSLDDTFNVEGRVKNNNIHDNFIGQPTAANVSQASANAAIIMWLDATDSSVYGNHFDNNNIYRSDASTTLLKDFTGDAYTLAQVNALTGSTGNTSAAPLFTDEANGDFLPASGSPLATWNWDQVPLRDMTDVGRDYDPLRSVLNIMPRSQQRLRPMGCT